MLFARRFSQSAASRGQRSRQIVLPHLKDKTPIVTAFHKDKKLPFNILRDVLEFPQIEQQSLNTIRHAWLMLVSVNDDADLKELVGQRYNPTQIWKASIRLANASPMILNGILSLWKDSSKRKEFRLLEDTPELLVGSLIYHQKYDTAFSVFDVYLSKKSDVNWKPIINVCLSLDNTDGIKLLSKMYQTFERKELYINVLPYLASLNLRTPYINKWNNELVAAGDFPRSSSSFLDPQFQSMLDSSNLRSLKNCLKNLGAYTKESGWLQTSTAKILARYISQSNNQTQTLLETLKSCGAKNFPNEFWESVYSSTSIPTAVLDHKLKMAGISPDTPKLSAARLKKLSTENLEHFWSIVSSESRQNVLNKSSLSILAAAVKSSSVEKSYEYCLHLLSLHPTLKDAICKTYIVEMSRKIKMDHVHTDVLAKLEAFLVDNNMMSDTVHNLYVYSDLLLSKYHSGISRLEHFVSSPEFVIDNKTMDNVVKYLTSSQKDMKSQLGLFDDNFSFRILELTMKCMAHCPDIKLRTWKRILNVVGENYEMDHVSKFFVGIADKLNGKNELRVHPANRHHPLKFVFDEQLCKNILEWGFTKSPENPWSGYELIKDLERIGVDVPENFLRKHLLRLTKVLHSSKKNAVPRRLRSSERLIPTEVSSTLNTINGIHNGSYASA